MEDTLSRILESDEHLIWQSRPEKFETLDKTHRKIFVRRVIIAVVATIVLISAYLLVIGMKSSDINLFVICAVPVIAALGPFAIFNYANKLRKKTSYFATNKRLIVFSGDLKTTDYEMIKEACFKTDEDGHTSLLCGKDAIEAPASKWRVFSLFGLNDSEAEDGPECERFAFYALPDPRELREVLTPYLKIR